MADLDYPALLNGLLDGRDLSLDDARATMASVLAGELTPGQMGGLLVALRAKALTSDEMTGFVRAMLDAAVPLKVGADAVDTCGTGGSEQRRIAAFHVSTLAGLVAAGAGARICKHGNRKASATSGSADLLEGLGVVIDLGAEGVARCVEEAGFGFCLAPVFHPGMRHPGPVRRELGVRTVFNMVAPLANPARVTRQVVGVADPAIARRVVDVLVANGAERAMVVHGHDGLDELTTTGLTHVTELCDGEIRTFDVHPEELGLPVATPAQLSGGDTERNVAITRALLAGEHGPHREVVCLNAAAALVVAGVAGDLRDGLARAAESLDSGAAGRVLEAVVRVSQEAAADRA